MVWASAVRVILTRIAAQHCSAPATSASRCVDVPWIVATALRAPLVDTVSLRPVEPVIRALPKPNAGLDLPACSTART